MVNAKFGGMYASFFRALDEYGNHAILTHDIVNAQADVLVVPMGGGQEYDSLQAIRRFTGPVVLYVPPASMWFDPDLLSRLQGKVLFAYGTDASTFSPQSYSRLGIRYHCIPFASDPEIMKPLNIPRLFDIVFVGSLDHAPHRLLFLEPLLKSLGSRNFLFIGSGWQKYGIPEQLVAWGPLLNAIYNLGRVCINIHTDEQSQGENQGIDLNNRVFDLAMAGCCQVCDNPDAIKRCFDENEVATAKNPEDWVEQVFSILDDPARAESMRQNAFRRAMRDHTWHQRAGEFLEILEPLYARWQPDKVGTLTTPVRIMLAEGNRRVKRCIYPRVKELRAKAERRFSWK